MILTDEQIKEAVGFTTDQMEAYRRVESKVLDIARKQILEEVCFKMASGSPNRVRIHDVLETWK